MYKRQVEAFRLNTVDIENDLGCMMNFAFELEVLSVAMAVGGGKLEMVELLLQGSLEEDPFDLGIEGEVEDFADEGFDSFLHVGDGSAEVGEAANGRAVGDDAIRFASACMGAVISSLCYPPLHVRRLT